ncbi:hypothetical protein HMPREF0290_1867 [Corynebacterium efficiens YS-314]|nr:hypothetical protein HMPREF0290_1867 [Corynebacterium efficiens YS-314]
MFHVSDLRGQTFPNAGSEHRASTSARHPTAGVGLRPVALAPEHPAGRRYSRESSGDRSRTRNVTHARCAG